MNSELDFADHLSALAGAYDAALCDVWGVLHNGVAPFPGAADALRRFRAGGRAVVLISNAPRPGVDVVRQIDRIGVTREAYDGIITSGDVTRAVMAEHPGESVFHIGPERDRTIFAGLNVQFATAETADYAVCTGLFDDDTETAEDYRATLTTLRARGLFMVCGNPDAVVERGTKLVPCAGAVADLYRDMGGEVLYAGKPYPQIYAQALAKAEAAAARPLSRSRILAIGDSIRTDLTGANREGLDFLFVTAGIHAEELGERDQPDAGALARIFAEAGVRPRAVARRLAW